MAINQYHLTVVPRQNVLRHWGVIPVKVQLRDNPEFDSFADTAWDKEQVDFGLIEKKILSFASRIEWTKKFEDGSLWG